MKYLLKIALGLIVCIGFMPACNDDDEKGITGFAIDKEDITIGAEGGTDVLSVSSEGEWVASASEPWVTISPANGVGRTECQIAIDSTLINGMREAKISFRPKGQAPQFVTIHQTGYGKMAIIKEPNVEIESSAAQNKRYFETVITTNVSLKLELEYEGEAGADWITLPEDFNIKLDVKARPRTAKVRFNWAMNPEFVKRVARIKFVPIDPSDVLENPAVLTVTQKAAPIITPDRAGDSLALLTIRERMNVSNNWDPSENMRNWDNVELWERTDEGVTEKNLGRVRTVTFIMFDTSETIPQEIHYLTGLQELGFQSNVNTMLKNVKLGSDICDLKLKVLRINAYGLVSLPDDFDKLGGTLEELDLSSNNFTSIPSILTKEKFPKLKALSFVNNRRWSVSDLRNSNDSQYENGIGLHFNVTTDPSLKNLLLWDTLEKLELSFNYMEGQLPEFKVGEDGVEAYTQKDVDAFGGDSIKWVLDNNIFGYHNMPKILPNAKKLSINLNFFTGKVPNWIKYHPHLMDWDPTILVFNQMENALNSEGKVVRFDDAPKNFDDYYLAYPLFKSKYELKDEEE